MRGMGRIIGRHYEVSGYAATGRGDVLVRQDINARSVSDALSIAAEYQERPDVDRVVVRESISYLID